MKLAEESTNAKEATVTAPPKRAPQYFLFPDHTKLDSGLLRELSETGIDPSAEPAMLEVDGDMIQMTPLKEEWVAHKLYNSRVSLKDDYGVDITIYVSYDSGKTGGVWSKAEIFAATRPNLGLKGRGDAKPNYLRGKKDMKRSIIP